MIKPSRTVLIVGAGISGCTLAERYANKLGYDVTVIEKRNHIGGNCYDYYDKSGVLVPKYGPHFFHTNDVGVWDYVNMFSAWKHYEHRVLSVVNGLQVPVPVNINTINILFQQNIRDSSGLEVWLKKNVKVYTDPKNSEESCISRVGISLYNAMFKNYTIKHWDKHPKELSPEVLNRIPIRKDFDDRYFTDSFQAMPKRGYTKMFENMLANKKIKVILNADYFKIKNTLPRPDKTYFTGPIDRYFDFKLGKLEYRSLKFQHQTLNMKFFQSKAQINYPNDNDFTRITEPKHATGQKIPVTTIIREYGTWDGDGYYPVPNIENQKLYAAYQYQAKKLEVGGTFFVGRLANYKYLNMDQAFRNALDIFEKVENNL